MYWGNIEERAGRKAYGKIREYIFAALIARTDKIDWLALDRGEITPQSVVAALIDKMEQYANYGFAFIQEKLEQDHNYFFKESAFLNIFTSFLVKDDEVDDNDEPDDLD